MALKEEEEEHPDWFKELMEENQWRGGGEVPLDVWKDYYKYMKDFNKYDKNLDGRITEDEMRRYMKAHPKDPS